MTVAGQENDPPRESHILMLGTCKCYLIWKKDLCRFDLIKDFEIRRLSWIIQIGPEYDHSVFIRELEGGLPWWRSG